MVRCYYLPEGSSPALLVWYLQLRHHRSLLHAAYTHLFPCYGMCGVKIVDAAARVKHTQVNFTADRGAAHQRKRGLAVWRAKLAGGLCKPTGSYPLW